MNSEQMLSECGFSDVGPHWDAVILSVGEERFPIWLLRGLYWQRTSDVHSSLTYTLEFIVMAAAMLGRVPPPPAA